MPRIPVHVPIINFKRDGCKKVGDSPEGQTSGTLTRKPITPSSDDSDDDVIIIEELSTVKRPRLEVRFPSSFKPSNELLAKTLQSETNHQDITTSAITARNVTDLPTTPTASRRGSFYNRKSREISHFPPTPTTPKLDKSNLITPVRNRSGGRLSSDGERSGTVIRQKSSIITPPSKSKRDELISSTYTTPKTTRGLSTPKTTRGLSTPTLTPGGCKLKANRRVTHLIYRPLELDNESSSESTDILAKRRDILRKGSQESMACYPSIVESLQ